MPEREKADLPLDGLNDEQREAFQTHLNDLWDDYADAMSSLAREAQTMVANATYDDGDPLANARAMLDRYARQANRLTLDYYRQVRSSWAEAAGVELPAYREATVTSDRAFWQAVGGYNSTGNVGLKYTDVINGRARGGLTIDDLWAEKTKDYGDVDWMTLAKDVVNQTARLTQRFTAQKDPSEPRWARVPRGPTCEFCIMLASRGYVYWSEEKAGGRDNRYHRNDDCQIVSSWGETRIKGYDPEGMRRRYRECADTIGDLLTRERWLRYAEHAEDSGGDADTFDEWKTKQILAEMRWRDRQWLYDGTEPAITFASEELREETERARPQEIRTAERLRRHGIVPAFQLDYAIVSDHETGDTERVGLADWAGGIEIKTVGTSKSFRTVDGYLGSASHKRDCTRLIIDNSESVNLSDEQLAEYVERSRRFHDGMVYVLTKDQRLIRMK